MSINKWEPVSKQEENWVYCGHTNNFNQNNANYMVKINFPTSVFNIFHFEPQSNTHENIFRD